MRRLLMGRRALRLRPMRFFLPLRAPPPCASLTAPPPSCTPRVCLQPCPTWRPATTGSSSAPTRTPPPPSPGSAARTRPTVRGRGAAGAGEASPAPPPRCRCPLPASTFALPPAAHLRPSPLSALPCAPRRQQQGAAPHEDVVPPDHLRNVPLQGVGAQQRCAGGHSCLRRRRSGAPTVPGALCLRLQSQQQQLCSSKEPCLSP